MRCLCAMVFLISAISVTLSAAEPTPVDQLLAQENKGREVGQEAPVIDDLAFLRRIYVDMIGRIPSDDEINEYAKWPKTERRSRAIEKLLQHDRFVDRWGVFFGDMMRIRSNADGGSAFQAFVSKSLASGMPYDEMCRQLIQASGRAGATPEVGFILGDNADPLALAAVTSQVFMGVRIGCAQCHDHPFDTWSRKQFYDLAAFFGKTQRIESQLTKMVYLTENENSAVLWPPEDVAKKNQAARKPVQPEFPFELDATDGPRQHIARLTQLRAELAARQAKSTSNEPSLDDLLSAAENKVKSVGQKSGELANVAEEARLAAQRLNVQKDIYKSSVFRQQLAKSITDPRNRYFSRALVNRVWGELLGNGFVNPVDDFRDDNSPEHPQSLDYLADELVASGYDFRTLVRLVVSSQAYQRGHLPPTVETAARDAAEKAFVATPVRRMLGESLFDSIAVAGHILGVKHPVGENLVKVKTIVRDQVAANDLASIKKPGMKEPLMVAAVVPSGYDLERAIEVDFNSVLAAAKIEDLQQMKMQAEMDLAADKMASKQTGPRMRYVERVVESTVDDNPRFASAMRMASPAPEAHFLRIFGQSPRQTLEDHRESYASMRQALMMLNGKLTHEASRVGKLEPMYQFFAGSKPDIDGAIVFAYREVMTRRPNAAEIAEAHEIVNAADTPLDGMADLRWALFNSHEFRFIP